MKQKLYNNISEVSMLIVLFFILQTFFIVLSFKENVSDFKLESEATIQEIEKTVQSSLGFIHYMSEVAEDHYSDPTEDIDPMYNELEEDSFNDIYYLSEDSDYVGNLVGKGSIPASPEALADISLAFAFNDYFQIFYEHIENVDWVYFISETGFISIYPTLSTEALTETPDYFMQQAYYVKARPENNPNHDHVWTAMRSSVDGVGYILTLSLPIYYGDDFKGVIAIDFSISDIKDKIGDTFNTSLYTSDGVAIASNNHTDFVNTDNHEISTEELVRIATNGPYTQEVTCENGQILFAHNISESELIYISSLPVIEVFFISFVKFAPLSLMLTLPYFFNTFRKKDDK